LGFGFGQGFCLSFLPFILDFASLLLRIQDNGSLDEMLMSAVEVCG
jgi:hypothetical protein